MLGQWAVSMAEITSLPHKTKQIQMVSRAKHDNLNSIQKITTNFCYLGRGFLTDPAKKLLREKTGKSD